MRGYETIVVRPTGTKDWRGDPTGSGGAAVPVEGCTIWPRTSTEDSSKGEIVIDGLNVLVPPPTVVTVTDTVDARGATWAVDGPPGDYRKKGRPVGLLVALKKVGA